VVFTNNLETGRTITDSERLEVHKNTRRLLPGIDYTISGTTVTIGGSILGATDIVTMTLFTQNVVPSTLDYRIFQDMLGNQRMLRINDNNTSELEQDLGATDDVIHVLDAGKFAEPDLNSNIFGTVTIDGERISYRTRDLAENTLSGLRRGTAGTGAAAHTTGTTVIDAGPGDVLPAQYQQTIHSNTFAGDGTTRTFVADDVTVPAGLDSTEIEEAVRVVVGGTELNNTEYTVTQVDPAAEVTLVDAPAAGVSVTVYIVKSNVLYAQGVDTASNGVALQEQNTQAVRFIKGDI